MKYILSLSLVCLVHFSLSAQQAKENIKVTDLAKIKRVSSVVFSHDNKQVVYSVNSILQDNDKKGEYIYRNQLFIVQPVSGAKPRALTNDKQNASSPVWSPDDKSIAFTRLVKDKSQLFILPLNGGEAIQITDFKYGVKDPKWSPDGKQILFSAEISLKNYLADTTYNPTKAIPTWPYEKPGFTNNANLITTKAKNNPDGNIEEIRAYLFGNEAENRARVINKQDFQDEATVNPEMNFEFYFIIDVKDGAKPKLVSRGFYGFGAKDFTRDGKIIFGGNIDSLHHPNRSNNNEIYIMNVDGSDVKELLSEKDKVFFSPKLSPSAKFLAFQTSLPTGVNVPKLGVKSMTGDSKQDFIIDVDRAITGMVWSKNEKYLYFTAQSNGGVPLFRLSLTDRKVERLSDFDNGIYSFDISEDKIAFAKTDVSNPSELYISDLSLKAIHKITSLNDEWLKNKQLSLPEKHTFTNSKGQTVEYWVMKPTKFDAAQKCPLVLEIHGGPSAMWGPGEASMWHEYQYYCSQGYGIVYCNPRGSGGYGQDFLRANIKDWGEGPSSDVLTALDKTVEEGWADASKLLVTGGSYAGYLTAWIISHDQRFAAACAQRGVYDLSTFFGEGNAWRLVPDYFGGYPWEPKTAEELRSESPITYVDKIKTPFIIFHGENDLRTGVIQSEMLYKSLKVLGRDVEYVRHPGATHEITRSGNVNQRIDQMLRTYEFFERYVGEQKIKSNDTVK